MQNNENERSTLVLYCSLVKQQLTIYIPLMHHYIRLSIMYVIASYGCYVLLKTTFEPNTNKDYTNLMDMYYFNIKE